MYDNKDPLQLVKKVIKEQNNYNHIWCVFDVDDFHNHDKIIPAYNLVKKRKKYFYSLFKRSF